jgi:flavin reductase (DIM6/NTAB) family NADH-FMN oxidoreductase RutF
MISTERRQSLPCDGAIGIEASFRAALRRLVAGVTIVSVAVERRHGVTATAFMPVSMAPPSIVVAINRDASIHDALRRASRFCVNILSTTQEDESRIFSDPTARERRFMSPDWQSSEDGVPFLVGVQANIFCEHARILTFGTHSLFIATVYRVTSDTARAGLLYMNGQYLTAQTLASGQA